MKLLLVNGNTTDDVTRLVRDQAQEALGPEVDITAVTAPFGPRYIAHRAESAIAAHAVLDALARHHGGHDAAVIACFGEPGLAAARELLPIPVTGMAEAGMLTACMLGSRFSIVTGGQRWVPMLQELAADYGLERRLSSVRAHTLTGGEIARDRDAAVPVLVDLARACIEEDGADCVVLGGAALAGLAPALAARLPVAVVDGLDCAVRQAVLLASLGTRKATSGSHAAPGARETTGLSDALAELLGRGSA